MDCSRLYSRTDDLITNRIIAKIPTNHIPNKIYPVTEGVLLFTESVKSFIQLAFPVKVSPVASLIAVPVAGMGNSCSELIHDSICGNSVRRNGRKGTASNPSSRNHRLYCIRLDRLFLNIRLSIKRSPMIPLIKILHMKSIS